MSPDRRPSTEWPPKRPGKFRKLVRKYVRAPEEEKAPPGKARKIWERVKKIGSTETRSAFWLDSDLPKRDKYTKGYATDKKGRVKTHVSMEAALARKELRQARRKEAMSKVYSKVPREERSTIMPEGPASKQPDVQPAHNPQRDSIIADFGGLTGKKPDVTPNPGQNPPTPPRRGLRP